MMCSWVKEFLSDENRGLQQLVVYMNFRYQIELRYVNQMCSIYITAYESSDI